LAASRDEYLDIPASWAFGPFGMTAVSWTAMMGADSNNVDL